MADLTRDRMPKRLITGESKQVAHPRISGAAVNDNIATADELFTDLDNLFKFTHDPCPLHGATTPGVPDGLTTPWGFTTFVNPPYSQIAPWLAKAVENMVRYGTRSVLLVPAHIETVYWDVHVAPWASEVWHCITGLRFAGYEYKFTQPMCLVLYGQFRDVLPLPRRIGARMLLGENYWTVSLLPRGLLHARLRRLDRGRNASAKRTVVEGKHRVDATLER